MPGSETCASCATWCIAPTSSPTTRSASEVLPLSEETPPPSPENGQVLQIRVGTSIDRAEQRLILATLELTGGDKKKAAEILGISLKTLYNRLNVYDAGRTAARAAQETAGTGSS